MRRSAARHLPPPARLRELVQDVAWGAAASELDARARVLLLPLHAQMPGGDAYISWKPAPVVGLGDTVTWTVVEAGTRYAGSAVAMVPEAVGEWPAAAAPQRAIAGDVARRGAESEWNLISELEQFVAYALEDRNRFVARELEDRVGSEPEGWAPSLNHGAVDAVALETLAGELLYGTADDGSSVIQRMVRRAALTNINNQPLGSWFGRNILPRAEEAIRRSIGDPHIGRKVRRIWREVGATNLDELLDAYRRTYPQDRIGRERAIAAISAGKSLDSISSSLSLYENPTDEASA